MVVCKGVYCQVPFQFYVVALNKQTIEDGYLLPRIDLLLDWLGQAKVFNKLDLAQGYHQIAMADDSVEKTAFCTDLGNGSIWLCPLGCATHTVLSSCL